MSLLSENVIPGNHGKVFSTNAREEEDLQKIEKDILNISGIRDIKLNKDKFPVEFTVHTDKLIKVSDIEEKVLESGFHAIPKSLFEL